MENRIIKFRAWDRENKTFRYPKLFWDSVMPSNWEKYYDISQYTGLKDKNGKEIYEGDIVKCHDHPTGVDDATGQVYYKDGSYMVQYGIGPLGDYGTAWAEVIGNVYENPDLIKLK